LLQFAKSRQLIFVPRDDEFAGQFVPDSPFAAKAEECGATLDAVARFERARLVVEAGMDDPAVMPTLMSGESVLGLEDHKGAA
jgi:hypothetical protein